ncbi:MAG: 50S ribosomal protein L6 [Candidatus Ancillula sp.]|jgi:large subunit ribosomal protein L6|nr:50S ribosomal protein L6 [Candidatus Ancillula sp.]
MVVKVDKRSRIGKVPVAVPAGVEISFTAPLLKVKGAKGELSLTIPEPVELKIAETEIDVVVPNAERISLSMHGLTRTLIYNMVEGVTNGYEKKMEIVGTGYRVTAKGDKSMEFALGKSHTDTVDAPEGITFNVEDQNHFSVIGIDKQQVGEVAANIRKLRKPEPYKGKGIKYVGEHIRRKVGKAGK